MSKNAEKQKRFRESMRAAGYRRTSTWVKEGVKVPNKNVIIINEVKRENCSVCGRKTDKLERHHSNYDKPEVFIWLCPQCHRLADEWRRNEEERIANESLARGEA